MVAKDSRKRAIGSLVVLDHGVFDSLSDLDGRSRQEIKRRDVDRGSRLGPARLRMSTGHPSDRRSAIVLCPPAIREKTRPALLGGGAHARAHNPTASGHGFTHRMPAPSML
jgi:hypothetical protein